MNKVLKIALLASVAVFFGCSGEGSVSPRANAEPEEQAPAKDDNTDPSESVPDEDSSEDPSDSSNKDNSGKEESSKGSVCVIDLGIGTECIEDLEAETCASAGGSAAKSCDSNPTLTCKQSGYTVKMYGSLFEDMDCDDFEN